MNAKPSALNDNIAVVRRLYEARGNPEVIRQILAPDVRWEVVAGFPHSDVYHGLSGVVDFFTRLFGDFEEWRTEPSEFFEIGDRVIAIGTYSGRAKATGKTFKAQFAHVWTLRDGVIFRLQQCADTAQLMKALGRNFNQDQT
jgi:ketosteroid isomerase-like protein